MNGAAIAHMVEQVIDPKIVVSGAGGSARRDRQRLVDGVGRQRARRRWRLQRAR